MKDMQLLEEIDLKSCEIIRKKRERQVLYDPVSKLIYKTWKKGWEFADGCEIGFQLGCYDELRVPNFVSFIKDKDGNNRGYVLERVPHEQKLEYAGWRPRISKMKFIASGEMPVRSAIWPEYYLQKKFFAELVAQVFKKAEDTNWFFTGIDLQNLWMSRRGYHLFDLDAIRNLNWLFPEHSSEDEYERKIVNQQVINRELRKITEMHGLQFPFDLANKEDISRFRLAFFRLNKHLLPAAEVSSEASRELG